MADIDVSVLMPCYNVEDFLDQALGSAEDNDRVSIEILAINDGSKDGSLEIMRAHAARDPRVRVIDKPNEGYGTSMNRGLDEARGTYVAILEPDDWVNPHMYDDLVEYARTFDELPDVVKTPYTRIWMPGTDKERHFECSYIHRIDPGFQPFTLKDAPRLMQHHPSIWSAIYRRAFLDENGIRFKQVPGAGWVDNPFLVETLNSARSIAYLDRPYYNSREDLPNSSSVKRTTTLPIERWNDMCDVMERLGVTDPGIWDSLAVIAFRYIGGLMDDGSIEEPEILEGVRGIFARLGRDRILHVPNISSSFKAYALRLIGEPVPKISDSVYHRALVDEFFYSMRTNGLGYALSRVKVFFARHGVFRNFIDPSKTRSAST